MKKKQILSATARRRKDSKGRSRITIFVDNDLWRWVKRKAIDHSTNNSALVECALLMLRDQGDLEAALRVYIEDTVGTGIEKE